MVLYFSAKLKNAFANILLKRTLSKRKLKALKKLVD